MEEIVRNNRSFIVIISVLIIVLALGGCSSTAGVDAPIFNNKVYLIDYPEDTGEYLFDTQYEYHYETNKPLKVEMRLYRKDILITKLTMESFDLPKDNITFNCIVDDKLIWQLSGTKAVNSFETDNFIGDNSFKGYKDCRGNDYP